MTENVMITREGGVATITVNRLDSLNALNATTLRRLEELLRETEDARAVVLTGAGEDAFVAGADISRMKELSVSEAMEYAGGGSRARR